jgi:hypothetical protein
MPLLPWCTRFLCPKLYGRLYLLERLVLGMLERSGKKRALAEKARLQQLIEGGDTYRSSSENPL